MSNSCPEKRFAFSVVMPVYNKEEYLREAFESIEGQTIGFEDNVQVVLINDGSTDSSAEICERFAKKHPSNVVYINQDNKGVSAARNCGLRHTKGDYVTFFDADDIWDATVFEKARDFFSEHGGETDILAVRLVQFGDISTDHPLDYKYEKTCVVDLNEHPDYVQPMIGNCIFSSEAVRDRAFDESLRYAEDTLFVNDLLLDKCTCGILADATYHYRKVRAANTASLNVTKARYENNNSVYLSLYNLSKERYGLVPPFIAYAALYELCWQIFVKCEDSFSEDDRRIWHETVSVLLSEITDNEICAAPWLTVAKRLCLLELKHGNVFLESIPWSKSGKWFADDGTMLLSLRKLPCIVVNSLRVRGDRLVIHGMVRSYLFGEGASLRIKVGGTDRGELGLSPFPSSDQVLITGERVLKTSRFSLSLPLQEVTGRSISIAWKMSEMRELALPIRSTLYGGLPMSKSYSVQDGVIVKRPKLAKLTVGKRTLKAHLASERRLLKSIFSSKKLSFWEKMRIAGLRASAKIYQYFKRRPIWIFIDREYKAGDSAEALYSYVLKQPIAQKVDLNFLLKKSSDDYGRLRSESTVLRPGSFRFHLKFLSAQKVFSGHHDALVTNPFGDEGRYFADMYLYDFYNLSHGTLQGDLSAQLNRHVRPIHRFFVSSEMERKALLGASYGYSEEEIRLSGMCRYDAYDKEKTCKKIIFMPTWRASLAGAIIPGTRERELISGFEESDYCRAYNSLINDERLLTAMRDAGYTGEFYVHPNYEKQVSCFHGNDIISVSDSSADYNQALSEGALLVTDYSGIAFDFAYMRKPIVYYQFDNLFDGQHSYQDSYFSYEEQGFGLVCSGQNELVSAIGDLLGSECAMSPQYQERADGFFAFSDRRNCERVLDVVLDEECR